MNGERSGRTATRFTSREIALLGLLAALWVIVEITVGGMVKGWRLPFGGAVLSAFGVVVLLTARAGVPRRWSSLLLGIVVAGLRFASGVTGAMFAAIGIVAEALIVEIILSPAGGGGRVRRAVAGGSAVLWALVHPFIVQGYLAGLGPAKVYGFTVGLLTGGKPWGSLESFFAVLLLIVVHAAIGVCAVFLVDRILLAPLGRAHGFAASEGSGRDRGSSDAVLRSIVLVAVVCALVGAAGEARGIEVGQPRRAASQNAGGTIYMLPELAVEATRLIGPYSVFHLDASEIRKADPTELSDILKMIPGVVVTMSSRGEPELSSRGLSEREIVVLVDGVPVSDPYTGDVNVRGLLGGALGTVRVTKGPAASVYGANALGGVIEVTTVGRGREGLSYSLSTGSDQRYSGYVSGGARVGRLHLSGGASANGRSHFSLPDSYGAEQWEDGGARDFSGSDDVFLWGSGSWAARDDLETSLSFQISDGKRDVPASTDSDRPRFWSFPLWRESRAMGTLAWRPADGVFLEGKAFCSTNDNRLVAYTDPERTRTKWVSTVSNRAFGGYLYSELRTLSRNRLSGGVNARHDLARLQSDEGREWTQHEATTVSVFGQDIVTLGATDRLTVAANVDVMGGEDRFLASFNPQAGWTHGFGRGLAVRLLAGLKTRFPTLKEWFSAEIGNPALDPERAVSVEVELSKTTVGGSRVSLLAYDQRVRDMIVSTGWGDPAGNIGSVTARGAELAVAHRLSRDVSVDVALAMTRARDDESGLDVEYVPRTTTRVATEYSPGPWRFAGSLTRIGSRSGRYGDRLPPHVLVDSRVALDTTLGTVFLGVENLFDELYEDENGFPQPGRSFEVGVMRDLQW